MFFEPCVLIVLFFFCHPLKLGQLRSLRTGLPSTAVAQPAVYVDVTPYDLSLIQCILQYNTQAKSSLPQGMVLSVIFAKDDSGADNRKGTQNWILGNTVRLVERLNIAGHLQLPGFERRDLVTATVRPTYNEDDYVVTMPLGEASLPVRQSWLDSSDAKFTKCQEQFHALIKEQIQPQPGSIQQETHCITSQFGCPCTTCHDTN